MLLRFVYLAITEFNDRTYDVTQSGGHLDYISYIASKLALPNPAHGWEYHQPPLYYALAALLVRITMADGTGGHYFTLQLLSLLSYGVFLVYSALIVERLFRDSWSKTLVVSLLVFWPAGVVHSVRIGNDVLFYALSSASMYYLLCWCRDYQLRSFVLSSLFAALGVLTKSNALILVGLDLSLLFLRFSTTPERKSCVKGGLVALLFFSAALAINFADNLYYYLKGESRDWLVGNVPGILGALMVQNTWLNYVLMDFATYLSEPFTHTWVDSGGRQYFWNFLLKTALFGEFSFDGDVPAKLALWLSPALLALLAYTVAGIVISFQRWRLCWLLLALNIFFSLALLISYRAKIPASSNGDFRYIFPVILSLCIFVGASIDGLWEREGRMTRAFSYCGSILAWAYVALSIAFFVSLIANH